MFKDMLASNAIGRVALSSRVLWQRHKAGIEHVGAVANEQLAEVLITSISLPDRVFVDIGGHSASIVAQARYIAPSQIVVFEADSIEAAKLQKRFPQVQVHSVALSDAPACRMDDVLQNEVVDAVKIGVDGALSVLGGAARILQRCRPTVMFESVPRDMGYTKEAMWSFLQGSGYEVFFPNRVAHAAPSMTFELFIDSHQYPRRTLNYIAVAKERVREIRDRARQILA